MLFCGKEDTGIESFLLQPRQLDIQMMCDGFISIPNLKPGTKYSIVKVYHNRYCTLATFNTSLPMTIPTMTTPIVCTGKTIYSMVESLILIKFLTHIATTSGSNKILVLFLGAISLLH